jgi:hypothetical protein
MDGMEQLYDMLSNFALYGDVGVIRVLMVLMVSCVLFWVKMRYFRLLILWYNVEYYTNMHC